MTDLIQIAKDYGPFVALVVFVMWENKQREGKYQERETSFIEETRARESNYIAREERYIQIIESLSGNLEAIQDDVSTIKKHLSIPDEEAEEEPLQVFRGARNRKRPKSI